MSGDQDLRDFDARVLAQTFREFTGNPAALADRDVLFTMDGAAYHPVTRGQFTVLTGMAPPAVRALNREQDISAGQGGHTLTCGGGCADTGGCWRCGARPWCTAVDEDAICTRCGADQDGAELTAEQQVRRDLRGIRGLHVVKEDQGSGETSNELRPRPWPAARAARSRAAVRQHHHDRGAHRH